MEGDSFVQTLSMPGVVKVYCVHSRPDFSLPWQRNRQVSSHSTGFMIDGGGDKRWLLTNAHSVEYHSQVPLILAHSSILRHSTSTDPSLSMVSAAGANTPLQAAQQYVMVKAAT